MELEDGYRDEGISKEREREEGIMENEHGGWRRWR